MRQPSERDGALVVLLLLGAILVGALGAWVERVFH